MSKFLLITLGFLFFISPFTFAGGVTGGGGGDILPEESVTTEEILKIFDPTLSMENNRGAVSINVLSFFYNYERELWNLPINDRLFTNKIVHKISDLETLLGNVRIQLNMKEACIDNEGHSRDGSVLNSYPPTICLSPYTMAKKLNVFNYSQEVLSLFIHELSHLLGFNEEECDKIQSQARATFYGVKTGTTEVIRNYSQVQGTVKGTPLLNLREEIRSISDYNELISQKIKNWKEIDLEKLTQKVMGLGQDWQFKLAMVPWKMISQLIDESTRFEILKTYLCSKETFLSPSVNQKCQEDFQKGFGLDQRITTIIWNYRLGLSLVDESSWYPESPRVWITKPLNKYDVLKALIETRIFLDRLQDHIHWMNQLQLSVFPIY